MATNFEEVDEEGNPIVKGANNEPGQSNNLTEEEQSNLKKKAMYDEILKELTETEVNYINALNSITPTQIEAMKKAFEAFNDQEGAPKLGTKSTQRQVQELFDKIEELKKIQIEISNAIKDHKLESMPEKFLASVAIYSEYSALYMSVANNIHPNILRRINNSFSNKKDDLNSLLIRPVQRGGQYEMIWERLSLSAPHKEELQRIKEGQTQLKEAMKIVNDSMKPSSVPKKPVIEQKKGANQLVLESFGKNTDDIIKNIKENYKKKRTHHGFSGFLKSFNIYINNVDINRDKQIEVLAGIINNLKNHPELSDNEKGIILKGALKTMKNDISKERNFFKSRLSNFYNDLSDQITTNKIYPTTEKLYAVFKNSGLKTFRKELVEKDNSNIPKLK